MKYGGLLCSFDTQSSSIPIKQQKKNNNYKNMSPLDINPYHMLKHINLFSLQHHFKKLQQKKKIHIKTLNCRNFSTTKTSSSGFSFKT